MSRDLLSARSRAASRGQRMGAMVGVLLGASCFVPTLSAAAGSGSVLEEPMQAIGKKGNATPACKTCTGTDSADGSRQRVAERESPEYPAPRRGGPMPMPPDDNGGEPVEPPSPEFLDTGSLLGPSSATISLPGVLP